MFVLAFLVPVFLASCNGDSSTNPEPSGQAGLPTVTTDTLETLGMTGVWAIGTVRDNGGAEVTDTGMCWSEASYPTIADSKSSWGLSLIHIAGWVLQLEPATHFKDGTAIDRVVQDDWYQYPFAAYCDYLDNSMWGDHYGRLYNWAAVMDPKGTGMSVRCIKQSK